MRRVLTVSLLLASAVLSSPTTPPRVKDKAYFASPDLVAFVRPGLVVNIFGATIGSDGTITVSFTATDPQGLPLDLTGLTTPGAVTASFVASYIPNGSSNWIALTTAIQTSPINGNSANQPAPDRGGTVHRLRTATRTRTRRRFRRGSTRRRR